MFKDCVEFMEAKLPLLPRYMKYVSCPRPSASGLPSWEYDPQFDMPAPHARSKAQVWHGNGTESCSRKTLQYDHGSAGIPCGT